MDMREASAMTEASGLTTDQDGVENSSGSIPGTAKDMSASPTPLDPDTAGMRFSDQLRELALRAPLQSLLLAFLLGVLVARRR
jgi:hypothetical protein